MSFFPLEYLKVGKVDFLYEMTHCDIKNIIKSIRKSPDRLNIINGFINILKDNKYFANFCYDVIYDIPEYNDIAKELIRVKELSCDRLKEILDNNCPYGLDIITNNLDYLVKKDDKFLDIICEYCFRNNNMNILYILSRYKNLHIRFLFMNYLILNHFDKLNLFYDDLIKYTTEYTFEEGEQLVLFPEVMNVNDISNLAISLLNIKEYDEYNRLKEYILKEYKNNCLASMLLKNSLVEDFKEDADRLFDSSLDFKCDLFFNSKYSSLISKELLDRFSSRIQFFNKDGFCHSVFPIYRYGLGDKVESYVDKYMDLSSRKDYEYIGEGTTSTCFRIGDYVIKLIRTKWSYEDVICPNIFLIVKDYEEDYIRDKNGIVVCGIEVQKFLSRKANIDRKYFDLFDKELSRLGYRRTDTLTGGTCGENTMLLDSYLDADSSNPELLPDWFKEYPLVLIDRDRIYKKDQECIKQLRCRY